MIIVRLMGGLGNQLFQYAAGRRLAEKNHDLLKLDITAFKSDELRNYELNHFNIIENFATPKEIIQYKKGGNLNRFLNHVKKNPYYPNTFIKEMQYHFEPDILNLTGDIYLEGYWQCEKYFKDIEPLIRTEFSVKTEPNEKNRELIKEIQTVNSVSIHIRRTDYVTKEVNKQLFRSCSIEYYQTAINQITRKVKNPYFFVFSDDILWARQNLIIDYPITFIDHNGSDKAYEDLRLMSLCKHQIIANSSFSWWGAWLNKSNKKIVISPKKWFNNPKVITSDQVPENWLKI